AAARAGCCASRVGTRWRAGRLALLRARDGSGPGARGRPRAAGAVWCRRGGAPRPAAAGGPRFWPEAAGNWTEAAPGPERPAVPVVADALDAAGIRAAVRGAEPDVVVHQLTAIPPRLNPRHIERDFALTNRLRTEGTDHLVSAARAAGAKRIVAQSFAGWPYA